MYMLEDVGPNLPYPLASWPVNVFVDILQVYDFAYRRWMCIFRFVESLQYVPIFSFDLLH